MHKLKQTKNQKDTGFFFFSLCLSILKVNQNDITQRISVYVVDNDILLSINFNIVFTKKILMNILAITFQITDTHLKAVKLLVVL